MDALIFVQPIRTKTLLLKGAKSKGPIISLSIGTNIVAPKPNEKQLGVKTNRKREVVWAK